jgi:hypothetical protein
VDLQLKPRRIAGRPESTTQLLEEAAVGVVAFGVMDGQMEPPLVALAAALDETWNNAANLAYLTGIQLVGHHTSHTYPFSPISVSSFSPLGPHP